MRLILTLISFSAVLATKSQTLFTEDFESAPDFTLNTSDANSVANVSNTWLINNVYAGGSGTVDCSGFILDFSIGATAGQPAGIQSPNGNYLHTASLVAIANGINCCSFGAADGFCTTADDIFTRMSTDVSTLGSNDVSLKFWWLCNGGNQNYGEVWYSTNSGAAWTQVTTPITQYRNQPNWSEQTVTIPAFGNQATLRFGFRFHNGESFLGGSDPGFAIDDVRIIAATTATITCNIGINAYCSGSSFNLPYTATGDFTAGNVFTAQLSDAAGSFAAPANIGTVSATASGVITCFIPPLQPTGNGYRVRVVSSTPAVTGTDNGVNITITQAPNAGADGAVTVCPGDEPLLLETGGDEGGVWSGPSPVIDGLYDPATMDPGNYEYTIPAVAQCPGDVAIIAVTETPGADAGTSQVAIICKNTGLYELFDFLGGTPDLGGTWTGPQGLPYPGTFNSANGTAGIYTYTVAPVGNCPDDEAVVTVQLGDPGNAGEDVTTAVCGDQFPLDLYTLLVDADDEGIWFLDGQPLFSGTVAEPGAYTYIDYAQPPCVNDTAQIIVASTAPAYAGENATATICVNGGTQALITYLGGSPQAGGTWTGPGGQPHPGLFDPTTDGSGLYTYTVQGGVPCPDDEAVLAVVEDPCTSIDEATDGVVLSWLGTDASGLAQFATDIHSAARIIVLDAQGRIVLDRGQVAVTGRLLLPVQHFANGTYTLRLLSSSRNAAVRFVR